MHHQEMEHILQQHMMNMDQKYHDQIENLKLFIMDSKTNICNTVDEVKDASTKHIHVALCQTSAAPNPPVCLMCYPNQSIQLVPWGDSPDLSRYLE